MDPDYQVGDLVEFVGSSQLYFHFPTDEGYNVQEGDIGIVIKTALNNFGMAYRVRLFRYTKSCCWFYEDELSIVSERKDEEE